MRFDNQLSDFSTSSFGSGMKMNLEVYFCAPTDGMARAGPSIPRNQTVTLGPAPERRHKVNISQCGVDVSDVRM